MSWNVQIIKLANSGVHKELRITCSIPQEYGAKFIKEIGWPTEEKPIFAHLVPQPEMDEFLQQPTEGKLRDNPAHETQPLETVPPAGVHNPYSRRAGILATNKAFHKFANIVGVPDPSSYAASYIRLICGVRSRKDILPGSDAAEKFDKLSTEFAIWNESPKFLENRR